MLLLSANDITADVSGLKILSAFLGSSLTNSEINAMICFRQLPSETASSASDSFSNVFLAAASLLLSEIFEVSAGLGGAESISSPLDF